MTAIVSSVNNVSDGKIAGTDDNPPGVKSVMNKGMVKRRDPTSTASRLLKILRTDKKKNARKNYTV